MWRIFRWLDLHPPSFHKFTLILFGLSLIAGVGFVLAMLCGLSVVFAGGVLWLAAGAQPARGLSAALAAGFYPFVLPDLAKLLVAAGVMPGLWRLTSSR